METVEVMMPYIGNCLSVNHYMGRRKDGGTYLKKETKEWMGLLTMLMRDRMAGKEPTKPIYISVWYQFKDRRSACDPNNLHKVIADALQPVLGNDKDFSFIDHPIIYEKDKDPSIWIFVGVKDARKTTTAQPRSGGGGTRKHTNR